MIWQRLFARHATNCLPSNTKYDTIRKREKNSVLSMFGHTKAASVLRHWSLFVLFGENTPNRVASALNICDTLICKYIFAESPSRLQKRVGVLLRVSKGEAIVWQ